MAAILLVKMSSLGDIVHTAHAVAEAKRARPELDFHWAVEADFADIARLHPGVRTVHALAMRQWRQRPLAAATWSEIAALRRAFKDERYQSVIDAQGLVKSLAVARLAGAPIHGFDLASAREPLAALGYHYRHRVARDLHAIERTRLLFAAALHYSAAPAAAGAGLRAPPAPPALRGRDDLAVLLHGTTWSSKRWPAAFWADLARRLLRQGYIPVLPWSNAEERTVATAVSEAAPGAILFPKGPLREIAGLLAASRLVVGVDTGLMHLAAAFGVRTVSLFSSTSPDLTGPFGAGSTAVRAAIACAPCRKRDCPLVPHGADPPCHSTIGADRVLAELAARGPARPGTPLVK